MSGTRISLLSYSGRNWRNRGLKVLQYQLRQLLRLLFFDQMTRSRQPVTSLFGLTDEEGGASDGEEEETVSETKE